MDTVARMLKDTKSITYTYDAYKSPTQRYDLLTHRDNKYVILHLPHAAYNDAVTRADVYVNWINNKQPDFIEEQRISDYSALVELIDAVEHNFDFSPLLKKYGILEVYGEAGATAHLRTYNDDFLNTNPVYGFNLEYIKRRCAVIYSQYRAWLSYVSTGTVDSAWKHYSQVRAKYDNLVSLTAPAPTQTRFCSSFLDVVESLLADLFILGNNALIDGQRIVQCRACGKEFVGTYNKNRQFCESCSTPAAKQKMYRMRKKEARHAQENNP